MHFHLTIKIFVTDEGILILDLTKIENGNFAKNLKGDNKCSYRINRCSTGAFEFVNVAE